MSGEKKFSGPFGSDADFMSPGGWTPGASSRKPRKVKKETNTVTGRKLRSKKTPVVIRVECNDLRVSTLIGRLIANELEHLAHTVQTDFDGHDVEVPRSHFKLLYRNIRLVTQIAVIGIEEKS